MEETAIHNHSDQAIERIFTLQSRNEAIISLQDSLNSFVHTLQATQNQNEGWESAMVEGLHFILLMLRDALMEDTGDDDTVLALTSDKSKLMEKIRGSLLTEKSVDLAERQSLFISTSIFERIVWLVRQIAISRLFPNGVIEQPAYQTGEDESILQEAVLP
jgi:phosphate:Na+ symporter